MTAPLKVNGVGRDAGHDCFVSVAFSRRPTDDELRAFHDAIRGMPIAAGEETCPKCGQHASMHSTADPCYGAWDLPPIAADEEDDRPGLGSSATPDRTAFPPIAAGGGETRTTIDLPLVNCPNCGIVKEPHDCRDACTCGLARNDSCPKHGTPIAAGGGETPCDARHTKEWGYWCFAHNKRAYVAHGGVIVCNPDQPSPKVPPIAPMWHCPNCECFFDKDGVIPSPKYPGIKAVTPSPSSSDLVERLRENASKPCGTDCCYTETMVEAADTIQKLEAEKERVGTFWYEKYQLLELGAQEKLAAQRATITALQSERDRLREALERTVKFNDVRIARAALGEKDG
jgi:hypothetical protein